MSTSFQDRVDAVFGQLQPAQLPAEADRLWTLHKEQVYRTGKQADYSSEEEEEATEAAIESASKFTLPRGLLNFEGTGSEDGPVELPTDSFCRALDREAEYDVNDAIATEAVGKLKDKRPPAHTEVLDENIFEVGSRLREALADQSQSIAEPTNTCAQAGSDAHALLIKEKQPGPRTKRVRFEVPPAPNGQPCQMAQKHPAEAGHSQGLQPQGRLPSRRTYVPDHVRHPEKYTVYTLDEPITVGGGNAGSADASHAENAQAARAAQTANLVQDMDVVDRASGAELLAFGAGITFKPSSKDGKSAANRGSNAADRVNGAAHALQLDPEQEAMPLEEGVEGERTLQATEVGVASDFKACTKKSRSLRNRTALSEVG